MKECVLKKTQAKTTTNMANCCIEKNIVHGRPKRVSLYNLRVCEPYRHTHVSSLKF